MLRNRLLEIHKENPFLSDHEVQGMKKCNFSEAWARKIARTNGWNSKALHGEAGSVDVETAMPKIREIRKLITEYELDNVYNMDETGLFFKCLPNRSYVKKEDSKDARGTKLMKAKDRVTVYVCTNATGTDKMPLSIIGKSKNPRCFEKRKKKLKYYSQRRARSDKVTFTKWWNSFLDYIRMKTTKKVLLLLDNCGPHGEELIDPRGQVKVVFLPPNCTSMFQPMDAGVIAMLKKNYRYALLLRMLDIFDDRERLRKQAENMRAGTKGLQEGHAPHLLDVMELLFDVWKKIDPSAINKCWIKSTLIGSTTPASADAPADSTVETSNASESSEPPTTAVASTTPPDSSADGLPPTTPVGTSASTDEEILDICNLVSRFAESHNGIQQTDDGLSDYDIMINEMVVALKGSGNKKEVLNAWTEMEDSEFCKDALKEEVTEILEDPNALIDLQYMTGDEDEDADGEEVAAPKVRPTDERLTEMEEDLKRWSVVADTFEGEFGDIAQMLADVSAAVAKERRTRKSKELEKKVAKNTFRQPNVAPFFKKVKEGKSAKKPVDKVVERNENAYWLLQQCKEVSDINSDVDETPCSLALLVVKTLADMSTKPSATVECDDDDDDDDDNAYNNDWTNRYMSAFSHVRVRPISFIMALTNKTQSLLSDDSLTVEAIEKTYDLEFKV